MNWIQIGDRWFNLAAASEIRRIGRGLEIEAEADANPILEIKVAANPFLALNAEDSARVLALIAPQPAEAEVEPASDVQPDPVAAVAE